jgi:hypothetical protein
MDTIAAALALMQQYILILGYVVSGKKVIAVLLM